MRWEWWNHSFGLLAFATSTSQMKVVWMNLPSSCLHPSGASAKLKKLATKPALAPTLQVAARPYFVENWATIFGSERQSIVFYQHEMSRWPCPCRQCQHLQHSLRPHSSAPDESKVAGSRARLGQAQRSQHCTGQCRSQTRPCGTCHNTKPFHESNSRSHTVPGYECECGVLKYICCTTWLHNQDVQVIQRPLQVSKQAAP